MAYNVRGIKNWGFQPTGNSWSSLAGAFPNDRANFLKSANEPLRYQIQWFATGLTEGVEPSASNYDASTNEGDLINVIFTVYVRPSTDVSWLEIGRIKKSRDMANKQFYYQTPASGHRFTVDVSQLVANELSYSLCPINKGTWQTNFNGYNAFGGMNGGLVMQDNVIGNAYGGAGDVVSNYNISPNGTIRQIKVVANFEIIDADGNVVSASGSKTSGEIDVINSVNQFEKDRVYYADTDLSFMMGNNSNTKYHFLSRCPNGTASESTITYDFKKPVRIDEQAEWLQFYIRNTTSLNIRGGASTNQDTVGSIGLKVETFDASGAENTFYLRDFEDRIVTFNTSSGYVVPEEYQRLTFVQNVSPYYINNTTNLIGDGTNPHKSPDNSPPNYPYWNAYSGDRITSDTVYYRVSMSRFSMWTDGAGTTNERRTSRYKYYVIDREDENNAYGFVRFHWLNSMGGIDSYTAKRDIAEGLTISRDVVERKSVDRTWYQDEATQTSFYISDTMRGGDIYKGGREVTNVNADKNQSAYTEPLNKPTAKWLQEIMLSPNVWIEMDTDATAWGNETNSHLRPSTKGYIPVIITNNNVETVNQEEGLVKFNIEYTLAHKVITQRN